MKALGGLIGLLIVAAIICFTLEVQWGGEAGDRLPPKKQIDLVGVQSDLLSIAQAERLYLIGHGTYAAIAELQKSGSLPFPGASSRGYRYEAVIDDDRHFRVIAAPADAARSDWPTLEIDETMQITRR